MTPDTVQRLRLHGASGADAVARRHRAEATLAGGLPAPRGLPAGALLCVRRLALRLPGGALATAARQAAPVLQRQIDEAWTQALRPGLSSPGAAVPALWFADEAELLVFLARRARAGDTAAWWWPLLAGRATAPWAAVTSAWLARPRAVPAALAALQGEAAAVCTALGEPGCTALAQAVASAFGVRGWDRPRPPAPQAFAAVVAASSHPAPAGDAKAPAVPLRTTPAAQAGVRSATSASATTPAAALAGPRAGPAARLVALARILMREPWAATAPDFAGRVEQAALAMASPTPPSHARAGPQGPLQAARTVATPVSVPRAPPVAGAPTAHPDRLAPPDRPPRRRAPAPSSPAASSPAVAPATRRIATPHAGLFFVVPLLLRHGCYGDFTQPAHRGLALHPAWLLLALLRRCATPARGDPLPALLRDWAGGARRPRGPVPWRPWFGALVQALQADAARLLARPSRGTLAWLVRQPGWVQLGETRLDVGFDLQQHPFAIRAAGLDRDVGWLPAGGRQIAFHFDGTPAGGNAA